MKFVFDEKPTNSSALTIMSIFHLYTELFTTIVIFKLIYGEMTRWLEISRFSSTGFNVVAKQDTIMHHYLHLPPINSCRSVRRGHSHNALMLLFIE